MKNATTIIALAIASSAATAGVLDMKFTGTGAGSAVQLQIGESDAFNVFAGQLNHEITGATGADAFLNGSHATFCADISEHVSSEFTQYQTTELENIPLTINNPAPMSSIKADAIRALYQQTVGTLLAGNLSNALGAAFQITIWEIVNDFDGTANSIDLTAGSLTFAGTNGDPMNTDIINHIEDLKISFMQGLNIGLTGNDQVLGLASAGSQDQLVTVPAPGAMALLAAGTLLTTRRRRS